jgi:transcriptional regulator with XRE-family HTH domain
MNQLVEDLLKAKENREITDDKEFAKLLGVTPSTWSKIKAGERDIGKTVLSRILVNLPELTKQVTEYMKQVGTK